jgi:hypothetical protein
MNIPISQNERLSIFYFVGLNNANTQFSPTTVQTFIDQDGRKVAVLAPRFIFQPCQGYDVFPVMGRP